MLPEQRLDLLVAEPVPWIATLRSGCSATYCTAAARISVDLRLPVGATSNTGGGGSPRISFAHSNEGSSGPPSIV
jgi:hypothetical protein